jgi:ribosomal protein S18 acetylase RimI-like enzyme
MGDRAEVMAFLRSFAAEISPVVEELPYGVGLFNPTISNVWDFNVVWIDSAPARRSVQKLLDDVERAHVRAGSSHRQLVVGREATADALGPDLQAAGYTRRRHVLMVQRRAPDRPSEQAVAELGVDELTRFSERELRHGGNLSAQTIADIVESKRIVARAGARFFGVRKRRGVVSACDLYLRGDLAQIEGVITDDAYRNRGFARAVVLRAAAEARSAGSRLVFLQAEEDDWPQELYEKLGFDTVGALSLFLRKPASSS